MFDWKGFHQEIHSNPDSTAKDKKFATLLLEAALYGVHDHGVFGEWHHLLPLCFNGAIECDANYSRLRPLMHVKVHAALCYFFPSSSELQQALNGAATPNCNNSRPAEDVSVVELLDDEDFLEQIAAARERLKLPRGDRLALRRPPSDDPQVNRRRATDRRTGQRRTYEGLGLPVPPHLQRRPTHDITSPATSLKQELSRLRNFCHKNKKAGLLALLLESEGLEAKIDSIPSVCPCSFIGI